MINSILAPEIIEMLKYSTGKGIKQSLTPGDQSTIEIGTEYCWCVK